MGKAVWTGTISFGLLNIDAALETASGKDPEDIAFKQLCPCHGEPIAAPRTCRTSGDEVEPNKGVEIARGQFVVIDEAELTDIDESFRDVADIIEIEHFVPMGAIGPHCWKGGHYFVRPYGKGVPKSLALLHTGLQNADACAIARVVMRSRQHICGLYAVDDALRLSVLLYEGALRPASADVTSHAKVAISSKEESLLASLIDAQLQPNLDLSPFTDEVVERKRKAVEEIVAGTKVTKPARRAAKKDVNLEDALEAMLRQAGGKAA